jgi:hypothetical protein
MISLKKFRYSPVALALLLGASFGPLPKTVVAQDVPPSTGIYNATATVLPNVVYEVAYAASLTSTETVVSIGNPSTTATCQVQVEWLYGSGGSVAGYSGPYNLSPQTTLEFTTANSGEVVNPFVLNVFRDTTTTFEGKARIRTNCSTSNKFGVNAVLAVGSSYIPLRVIKPSGNVGD